MCKFESSEVKLAEQLAKFFDEVIAEDGSVGTCQDSDGGDGRLCPTPHFSPRNHLSERGPVKARTSLSHSCPDFVPCAAEARGAFCRL